MNDPNVTLSGYLDRTAVPPTYPVVPGYPVFMGLPQPSEALDGFRGGVHGVHDLRLHKPTRVWTFHSHVKASRGCVATDFHGSSAISRKCRKQVLNGGVAGDIRAWTDDFQNLDGTRGNRFTR